MFRRIFLPAPVTGPPATANLPADRRDRRFAETGDLIIRIFQKEHSV
jgi:hypothetical protein